ncbi:MAG: cyclic nucleotide-binding domain-containing protein [Polaromonas sp.]|uniref:cyclic nucleotide-binding domain-containing protein n=1 Tax=Polaromonas sp. TaxID=1869339 RepID=UPI0027310832|nr:cyclic nucleotide-binding domain-containing protein [Polaromonas sp.]MDP1741738.1 cyclic nucleotide-binding domain-containing protein [Polaromonas sp.]MDP1956088.1 cyclic nucleotide-binding domain-containing protein [Polaromonas sp.]MDP3752353.1 cyclic nucleotide-binding domain-containing protein [Polaromonas sp.]
MAATGPLNPDATGAARDVRSEGPPRASTAPLEGIRRPAQDERNPPGPGALSLEDKLGQAGLELLGNCQKMSGRGPTLLTHSALLEDFTPQELDTLGEAMLLIRAQPGQVLISEGDQGDWMLLLLSGTVDVTKSTSPDENDPAAPDNVSRLGVVTEGAALGEMSMFDRDLRYATCTAIDAVEAAVLSRAAIGQLIRQHPGVGAKLVVKITQLLAQRLRNTSNRLVKMLQK